MKVGSPKKKAPKPEPRPALPGKVCPNCGETRERPTPGDRGVYFGWETWTDAPHENPFDCIRFLKRELDSVKDDVQSVKSDLDSVDAPKRDRV